MTFYRSDHAEDLYSVSVVEPRSAKQYGYIVPSSFSFDCAKGKGSGFVAMGINRSQDFIVDVVKFYLLEFCTRNGYQYEDQVK
ncbi:putative conserved secreted protein [Synechococcus sp. PROS-7-1]|nr:putative conserved secreted protein [Synechococcus sp. PROS-7-1]